MRLVVLSCLWAFASLPFFAAAATPSPVPTVTAFAPDPAPCAATWCTKEFELRWNTDDGQVVVPVHQAGWPHLAIGRTVSSVTLVNHAYTRVMVLFSVNGLNPDTGKPALRNSRGYLVPARGQLEVPATHLAGQAWFSPQWSATGNIQVNVYPDRAARPVLGGEFHQAPPEANDYLVDPAGRRYWVAPAGFPFRHANPALEPRAKVYMTYALAHP
jgi:hypothetical protein